jgi:hypothetical protein
MLSNFRTNQAIRTIKKNEINIILGDFNAKIVTEEVVRKYDFGDKND